MGGLILLTNTRTLFDVYSVAGELRHTVYVTLVAAWLVAVGVVIRRQRRTDEPLFNRERKLAIEQAG